MAATGREVHEPRRLRPFGAHAVEPVDRLLGHVVREVVRLAVLALRDALDLLVLGDDGVVLARLTPEEAPVVVEPEPGGPAVERAARALLVVRGHVPLPDRGGHVAVLLQDSRERRAVARDGGVVAGERAGELGHETEPDTVLVAAREHRRTRRRADGRHVEAVVAEPLLGDASVVRSVDRAAEGARVAESRVVDQHEEDVRGALGRRDVHRLVPVGHRALECLLRLTRERRAPDRQHRPVDGSVTHRSTLLSLVAENASGRSSPPRARSRATPPVDRADRPSDPPRRSSHRVHALDLDIEIAETVEDAVEMRLIEDVDGNDRLPLG